MYDLPVYHNPAIASVERITIFIDERGYLAICNPLSYHRFNPEFRLGERSVINMAEYNNHLRGVWESALEISK